MHLVEIKIKGKIEKGGSQREGFINSFEVAVFKLIYLVFMSYNLWTSS
jgi:hypothetical protein